MLEHDIQTIRDQIRKMATMVVKQLKDAVRAFADRDRKLAYTVILKDYPIDIIEDQLDYMCQEFLVRHMPVSRQLRFIVAVAKVNSELERIGDYAESMARRAVTVSKSVSIPDREKILAMSEAAFAMLDMSIDSFLNGDPELAKKAMDLDATVDKLNSEMFNTLACADVAEADLKIRFALLGLVNRIERVADRASNIAEDAIYVITGKVLRHLSTEDTKILFHCDNNNCLSQVAEAIARNMAPPRFKFSSAGTQPGEMDPRVMAFLEKKGIDISGLKPKGFNEIEPIENYHIIVTLSQEAEEAGPPIPYNSVRLTWDIQDPSKLPGDLADLERDYQELFDKLTHKIEELVEGLMVVYQKGIEE